MPHLGMGELLIILTIVMVIFGANKLPALGDGVGKAIRNFKRATSAANELEVAPRPAEVTGESAGKPPAPAAAEREPAKAG